MSAEYSVPYYSLTIIISVLMHKDKNLIIIILLLLSIVLIVPEVLSIVLVSFTILL